MHISMKGICKSFGDVQVLRNVSLQVGDGEIHALVGENGAGKSTLMKILTGVYSRDAGEIHVDGRLADIRKIRDSEHLGIAIIHQELNMLPEMSLTDNLFLGHEIKNPAGILNLKAMKNQAKEALTRLGLDADPGTKAKELTVGQLQLVEIARALMRNVRLIVMDEPTSALTDREIERLFEAIRGLKAQGVSFVYISHRMEELFSLCDRVTVMRDGCTVGEKAMADTTFEELVTLMVGRDIGERFPPRTCEPGEVIFRVEGLCQEGNFRDISFDLRKGEVLGFAGLMGSGRTEIMHALFGSTPLTAGAIVLNGRQVAVHSPKAAMELGLAFVTEDRKKEGLFLDFSVAYNMASANLKALSNHGIVDRAKTKAYVSKSIADFRVKTASQDMSIRHLSGGNQQKVILAKWLGRKPQVLILDEPTRGVDVGAKREIYEMIDQLAAQGMGIIMVSSELPEILGLCDRTVVMREGHLMGILDRKEFSQEKIMSLATGGSQS